MRRHLPHLTPLLLIMVASLGLGACTLPTPGTPASAEEIRSSRPRAAVTAPAADLATLTASNTAFALDLYHALARQQGNLFFSPHSMSLALAITSAGARGTTVEQMRDTLHVMLPDERLHAAYNALDTVLTAPRGTGGVQDFTLRQANALWGQRGHPFQPAFLDLLAQHYGAGLRVLDFSAAPEAARARINAWVAAQTEQKITDLLPAGAVTGDSRLVLANALYFKAKWQTPFEPALTQDGLFTLTDGTQTMAPLMHGTQLFDYTEDSDYQAVRLPYRGDMAMIVLLPRGDSIAAFERVLTTKRLDQILGRLQPQNIVLTLPKLNLAGVRFRLKPTLEELGMRDAFTAGQADFSGMDGTRQLVIDDVYHQAAIIVDEEGTTAVAATGSSVMATSAQVPAPGVEMRIDHPFILFIRDMRTGALLFAGRIVDPRP